MPAESTSTQLKQQVTQRYQVDPATVRVVVSPYRICPLGAHIDHQLGPVTAMALDQHILLAYAPTNNSTVRLSSQNFPGEIYFDLNSIPDQQPGDWGNFPRGAARALQQKHQLSRGLVGMTSGKMAEGGLSSSAAIGIAYLLALEEVNQLEVTRKENIHLDQAIENHYLGLRNGILDQSAILLSKKDHLTLIDCYNVTHRLIPPAHTMPPYTILIAFSGLRQALVGTDYNRRVEECTEAAQILLKATGRSKAKPLLGHLNAAEYALYKNQLKDAPAKRAAHFFSEVERVELGIKAWQDGDLHQFGRLISASGHSSIHQYECGCPPLIELYDILLETTGVYGTRFSGAGFRGCCVALVDSANAQDIATQVQQTYAQRHPDLAQNASVLLCQSDDGARII